MTDYKDFISNQPTENIGMIGHVSNGKSTIVRQLTGVTTQKHSKEQERNLTIKLGYANAKIFKCSECPEPECYSSTSSDIKMLKCKLCNNYMDLIRHISLVDCPGHNLFMSTMINGSGVMHRAITVESFQNPELPAPQTIEHLKAIKMGNIKSDILCLNKMDLNKSKDEVITKINKLKELLRDTPVDNAHYIPISASMNINMDALLEYIVKYPHPIIDIKSPFEMPIIRSFNVNKPHSPINSLKGGVIGGSVLRGLVKTGDKAVILPGYINKFTDDESNIQWEYKPLYTDIKSINSDKTKLEYCVSGGLVAIMTTLDPGLTGDDNLVGNIIVPESEEKYYNIYERLIIKFESFYQKEDIKKDQSLLINSNGYNGKSTVVKYKNKELILKLDSRPICAKNGSIVTISTNDTENNMRVLGKGSIIDGLSSKKK
jgi:translation initiation factor 2 subunit 3